MRGEYKARVNHQIMDLIESRSTSASVCHQFPGNANENQTDRFLILDNEVSQVYARGMWTYLSKKRQYYAKLSAVINFFALRVGKG